MTENYGTSLERPLTGAGESRSTMIDGSNAPLPTTSRAGEDASASDGGAGTAQAAKDELRESAAGAKDAGAKVAQTAKDEASKVTTEAGQQAKELFDQTRREATTQLGEQQQRVAVGLKSLGQELSAMAGSASEPGVAADLAQQAAQRVDSIATWLQDREPGAIFDDVKAFARERPGTFLALAAGAGVLAGRLTSGLKAANDTPTADVDRPEAAGNGTAPRHADISGEGAGFTGAGRQDWATPTTSPAQGAGLGSLP